MLVAGPMGVTQLLLAICLGLFAPIAQAASLSDILAAAPDGDWRKPDPGNTLYLELASGRVVIELNPKFAPNHVAAIKALVEARQFDGQAVMRVQDNYVAQWGNGEGKPPLKAEFAVPIGKAVPFTPLGDSDVYAPQTGFVDGLPVARDPKSAQAWLAHCYAMVGVGRDVSPDSGNGAELYAVIGHAPRHLDRNVTLVGRVIQGIEHLSSLPRGTGPLGFYEKSEQTVPIKSVRLARDVPEDARSRLEILRSDSATFKTVIASRRARKEDWFAHSPGHIELCNVPLPVRER